MSSSDKPKIHIVGSNTGTVTDATRKQKADAKLKEMATAKVMKEAGEFMAQILHGVDRSKFPPKFVEQLCFSLVSMLTGMSNRIHQMGGQVMQLGAVASHAHATANITVEAFGRLEAQRFRQAKKVQDLLKEARSVFGPGNDELNLMFEEFVEAMNPDGWACENALKMNALFKSSHDDLVAKAQKEQAEGAANTVQEGGQKLLFENMKEFLGKTNPTKPV